jgi:hypothetical protein
MPKPTTILAVAWAGPWTLFGLALGSLGLLGGGSVQRTGRVVEFWGGWLVPLLRISPLIGGAAAITFGHTVLARSKPDLDASRRHERVHVRQYEHWGPLFIPAYLLCALVLWLAGRNSYYDNPFERQAFDEPD